MLSKLFIGSGQHRIGKVRIAQDALVALQAKDGFAKFLDRVPASGKLK